MYTIIHAYRAPGGLITAVRLYQHDLRDTIFHSPIMQLLRKKKAKSLYSTSSVSPQTYPNQLHKLNRQHIFISVCTTDKLFFPGLSHERSIWSLQGLKGQKVGVLCTSSWKSWASRQATARLQMTGDNKMYKTPRGSSQKSARLYILLPTPGVYRALRHNPSVRSLHSVTCRDPPSTLR